MTPTGHLGDWDLRLASHADARPTMTAWWAAQVQRAFGGELLRVTCEVDREHYEALVHVASVLAPESFLLGTLGHGAVRAAGSLGPVTVGAQCRVAEVLERELGLPCCRLVTPPIRVDEPLEMPHASVRTTQVVCLPSTEVQLWASFRGSVRTAVRAGARAGDVIDRITSSDSARAVDLLHATQERVQAGYLTPPRLVEQLLAEPGRVHAVGVRRAGVLVCVSMFVTWGRHFYYALNGYKFSPGRASPTYGALYAGLLAAQQAGCTWVDLGHSATASLYQYKQYWGGVPQRYLIISGPTSTWSHDRAP